MIFTKEAGFSDGYSDGGRNRLNARFEVFMVPFKAEFEGRRVLDLASHDGRWSYAALALGAAHVTGVEGRAELVERGERRFEAEHLCGRADFIVGDIIEVMSQMHARGARFDVILCLGIFYHVMDHFRLLKLMRDFDPSLIILDTSLINEDKPMIALQVERTDRILNAIAIGSEEETVVGFPSRGALEMMAANLDLELTYLPWMPERFDNKANLEDYFTGDVGERRRYSAILRKR